MTAALIIFIAAVIIFTGGIAGTWAVLRGDDHRYDRDPFAHLPVPGDGESFGAMPPEIAHEEYLPAQLAACPATPPDEDSGVWADRNAGRSDSALGSPAHDHALAGTGNNAAGLPTLANPTDTLAPAAPDETPVRGPATGARAPEPPAGEAGTGGKRAAAPATEGDDAPGPASLPEGNEPAARSPQEAPARGLDPLAKARAAMDAVAKLEPGDYLQHLDAGTGYADPAPWNPLSAATIARGIPVIRDEVAP